MAEETEDASRTIPLVVVWAVAGNALMLLVVGITFIFCLGDLDSALNSPTGQPMIQVFYNATQSVAGTCVMVTVVIIIFMSACIGQVATSSRQMWSFARDQGTECQPPCDHKVPKLVPHPVTNMYPQDFQDQASSQRYHLVGTYQ